MLNVDQKKSLLILFKMWQKKIFWKLASNMFVKCARKLSRKKKNGNYFKSDEEKKLTFFSKKSIFKSLWTISMPVEWLGPRYNCHSINKYPFLFSFLAWRRRELGTTWYILIQLWWLHLRAFCISKERSKFN